LKETPALKQYKKIKEKYKDAILLFRMGDFYEMFFEDAKVGAKILGIALTSRPFGKNSPKVPMAGIPHHALNIYLPKLIDAGYKVAICEQIEEPKPGKVVEREVVRVITPGTYFEDERIERYFLALYKEKGKYYVALVNSSTGDFYISSFNNFEDVIGFIYKYKPNEILFDRNIKKEILENLKGLENVLLQEKDFESIFLEDKEYHYMEFTPEEKVLIINVLEYLKDTQKDFLPKIKNPTRLIYKDYVEIDQNTIKNLEILENYFTGKSDKTLLKVLDFTKTKMGHRKLKFLLLHPLKDLTQIKLRQSLIENLLEKKLFLKEIQKYLSHIFDIDRILTKLSSKLASPKDLEFLRNSLKEVLNLLEFLKEKFPYIYEKIFTKEDVALKLFNFLSKTLNENLPQNIKDGYIIKRGVNKHLDELYDIKENIDKYIKLLEEKEREKTKIPSLKIKYNQVLGYFIEIPKTHKDKVPKEYIRRQTLTNAERYTTEELKDIESKFLTSQEEIINLETEIFNKIRNFVLHFYKDLNELSDEIGFLDALTSFAEVILLRNWCKVEYQKNKEIYIKEGKHPILEAILDSFIPNDTIAKENENLFIITGPNMGGKSVYIRQIALIFLLSQVCGYVPAKEAKLFLVDKIFSRVGASDDLTRGISTFMLEMLECSNILKKATDKSLVILDEIGRGTATFDGLAIARAVIEELGDRKTKTFFATHYHELTALENERNDTKNLCALVKEMKDDIIFTHKIVEGKAAKSYGIVVAKKAGFPKKVIDRALELLNYYEKIFSFEENKKSFENTLKNEIKKKESDNNILKEDFFLKPISIKTKESSSKKVEEISEKTFKKIKEELEKIDIANITPLEALIKLNELKNLIKK